MAPPRLQMRQESRRLLDRNVLAELELAGICARREPLEASADAGREFSRIAEPERRRSVFRCERCDQRAGGAVEIDDDDRTFGFALLRIGKELARPLA